MRDGRSHDHTKSNILVPVYHLHVLDNNSWFIFPHKPWFAEDCHTTLPSFTRSSNFPFPPHFVSYCLHFRTPSYVQTWLTFKIYVAHQVGPPPFKGNTHNGQDTLLSITSKTISVERVCGARSAVHENPHKKVVTCNCRQLIERTPPSFLTEHLVLTMHEKHRAIPFPSQHLHIFSLLVLFWPFPRPWLAGFHWIAMIFYTTKVKLHFVEYIFWLPSFRHGDIILEKTFAILCGLDVEYTILTFTS